MKCVVHVLTDGVGDSGTRLCHAVMKQFPRCEYSIAVHRFIRSEEAVDRAFETITSKDVILSTLIGSRMREYCAKRAENNPFLDVTGYLASGFESILHEKALDVTDPFFRSKDANYFKRIDAIEFAVKYDDGKDVRGIGKADAVLVGVSRTSKTPTGMYLANYNLKVANLPLVPEIPLPREIFEKDKNRVFGLIIDMDALNRIRMERLREMGLDSETSRYADMARIQKELEYARNVMDRIGCYVIDVSNKNIEETAVIIMNRLEKYALK